MIVDSDVYGDWVALSRTPELERYHRRQRGNAWQYPGSRDAPDRLFPRTNSRFVHSYKELNKFLTAVSRVDEQNEMLIVSNVLTIMMMAIEALGRTWSIEFVHASDIVGAWRDKLPPLPPAQRFDIVIANAGSDLFQFDETKDRNLSTIDEIKRFYCWVEKNVGPLANGATRDVTDAASFKTEFPTLFADSSVRTIPTISYRGGGKGSKVRIGIPWHAKDPAILDLTKAGFQVRKGKYITKQNFSYGGQGVKVEEVQGDKNGAYIETDATKGAVVQPYVTNVEELEYKIMLPKGAKTNQNEQLVNHVLEGSTTTLDMENEWFDPKKKSPSERGFNDPALRAKLSEFLKNVLECLEKFQFDSNAQRYVPARVRQPFMTHRHWVRIDVAWNGKRGNEAEFLINEMSSAMGTWTYNQNLDMGHLKDFSSDTVRELVQNTHDGCMQFIRNSVEGMKGYLLEAKDALLPAAATRARSTGSGGGAGAGPSKRVRLASAALQMRRLLLGRRL